MNIKLREAQPTDEDAQTVMRLRNDPSTLEFSFHHEPKVWPTFREEYLSKYLAEGVPTPLFAFDQDEVVGFLRFRHYDEIKSLAGKTIDISIIVAPECRGKGYGSEILKAGNEKMFSQGIDNIIAEIRTDNTGSVRAFEKAGYRYFDRKEHVVEDTREKVEIFRYLAKNE